MAAATVIRYSHAGDRVRRIGMDLGTDPSAMTGGNNVTDGRVDLVAVAPAGVSSPGSPHVVATVYEGAAGESFDPAAKCVAFHATADAVRIFASSTGALAWTFHYVLVTPAARTI
jgi:hypothetical protein